VSAEERDRLQALTPTPTEAAALEDPDNLPTTEVELDRMILAREVRQLRERTGLSQFQFALCYRLGLNRRRDWEQGRFPPDVAVLAFLQLISDHPDIAEAVLEKVSGRHLVV
jgi:putative transcriptional regulator